MYCPGFVVVYRPRAHVATDRQPGVGWVRFSGQAPGKTTGSSLQDNQEGKL